MNMKTPPLSGEPTDEREADANALRAIADAGYKYGRKVQALIELVAADDAHQAWCLLQRLKPRPLFDSLVSGSSSPPMYPEKPEREAIIARLNAAWESARAALAKRDD